MSDFSRSPLDLLVASQQKGYVGLHIEQGVPLLDRDLNLLHDLITATVRSVITRYIGNGIPAGADGFAIQALPAPADNLDFRIGAGAAGPGTCLVDGIEVTIPADISYTAQAGVPPLSIPSAAQPDPRTDIVYLDVSFIEVDGTSDPDLNNSLDVGMQTSVRLKPTFRVLVSEGVPPASPAPGHHVYPLARLLRPRGISQIQASMISDLRQTRLNLAEIENRLSAVEKLFLPAFNPSPNQFNPKFGIPGASVTLLGKNFNVGTSAVRFGATAASIKGTPTSTQIVVAVPAMAPGAVQISVQTGAGSIISNDNFTVLPLPAPVFDPPPNQFNPKFGPANTNVTLMGSNFNIGPVAVRFGATAATLIGTPTATRIVAAVPVMPPGAAKITVQTGGGLVTSSDDFTVT
ncbi:IPT/TIG domain-containing protein [Accumulibacter sp.]|uniref:IPT/TIG domain-containing protein n=1 Tax=Accumulibacter sp. TaxID=2053492 RepID=UPI003314DFE9